MTAVLAARGYDGSPDGILIGLPYSQNIDSQAAEEQPAMESERPKYSPVVFLAMKHITAICEDYIFPVDIICTGKARLTQPIYISCLWDSSGESIDNNWENSIH